MKVAFFGTPEFAVPTLEAILDSRHEVDLVVAQPDRPSGRGLKLRKPPVAQLAVDRGIELRQPERPIETIELLQERRIEIAVVVAYGRILPRRLIDSIPHGFINVHASLLPSWRGAAPIQRAIEAGERETGVSIMRIDEQLDHGPVFAVAKVEIGRDDLAPMMFEKLAVAGGPLLVSVLDAIEAGTAVETPQDHSRATHAAKLDKQEGRIDWSLPARRIYDRYRAFHPWPGVYFEAAGEPVRVSEAAGVTRGKASPGTILSVQDDVLHVATGEDALVIRQMQRAGRRSMSAGEVVRGLRLSEGDRLA